MMTLCLSFCNVAQNRLRNKLKEEKGPVPNLLEKDVQNPTIRWVFQIMKWIGMVRYPGSVQGSRKDSWSPDSRGVERSGEPQRFTT
ncbi:MAG: hypothetical protein M3Y08_17850, partial [Fibrobacterota bacterium]|nr:hypothetical protein [Fibrobacterota bacterium]